MLLAFCLLPTRFKAQARIDTLQHIHYSKDEDCFSQYVEFSLPKANSRHPYLQRFNKQVLAIAEAGHPIDHPSVHEMPTIPACQDQYLGGPDEHKIYFETYRNTNRLLSLVLYTHSLSGNGGHGGKIHTHHFNLDLRQEKNIQVDDLFSKEAQAMLMPHIIKAWEQVQGPPFETNQEYNRLIGINLGPGGIYFYFSYYLGHSNTTYVPVFINNGLIKPLINKEYRWILDD